MSEKPELSDREILTRLAEWIVERRMSAPAIVFLESHRPLSFVGAQAMIAASPLVEMFEPFFRALVGPRYQHAYYRRFAEMLEDRDTVERLIIEIERKSQDFRARLKEEKRRARRLKREAREKRKALRRLRRQGALRRET